MEDGPKILVGSILANSSPLMEQWLDLQRRFLNDTTPNYSLCAYLSEGQPTQYLKDRAWIVPRPDVPPAFDSKAHIQGLITLWRYFKKRQSEFDAFLFLDMDSFPIRRNWANILLKNMAPNSLEIAVVLRPENLETRLHSSVLFAKREALEHLRFEMFHVGSDLLCQMETDVSIPTYQEARRNKVFPLLRSNRTNIHPLLFGVYYDLFYHNGCGTGRRCNMRGLPYWSHISDPNCDVMETTKKLFEDPNNFIRQLTGWRPDEYAKV